MQAFFPYRISHIYLNQQLEMPPLAYSGQGHYLVFWWQQMALGHLFLAPGQPLSEADYYRHLAAAIQPALSFYQQDQSGAADWPLWLQTRNFTAWTSWMNTIFSGWTAVDQPARVPVSVIICTRNRTADLQRCLDSIKNMPCQPAEIIVVDNARINDQTEKLVKTYPGVAYCQETTPGLSYARNTGVRQASQEIISFTDDDVLVHPDWTFRIWETFRNKQVAASTGLVLASELITETQLIFEKHWSFNQGYADKYCDPEFFNKTLRKGPPVWEIGAGANMAFRREIFAQVGLFDERLGAGASGCSEDSEIWYRILLGGHAIHYTPRAIVFHRHRQDIKALHQQLYSYMRGFTVAALLQQEQQPAAGYKRHLFLTLPKYYSGLLYKGFPRYRFRFRTLGSEIKGLLAGFLFYFKNRHRPPQTKGE